MRNLLLTALFSSLAGLVVGQLPTYNMSNMTVTDCDGELLDSDAGNNPDEYAHNEDLVFSICPPNGAQITLSFSFFSTEACCDFIRFFNGPDTFAPLISTHSGTTIPGPIVASSGCLTIHFKTDANIADLGWISQWSTVMNPPIPPAINAIPNVDCSVSSLTITLDQPIPCSEVYPAAFTITGPGGAAVANASPAPCSGGMTSTILLTLSPGFTNNGTHNLEFFYTYTDICDSVWTFLINQNFDVINCPINANIMAGSNTICLGDCTNLTGQASGGNPANYQWSWSHGLPPTPGPHVVCPTTTTTYSLTVSDGVSAPDMATRTITVVPKPNAGPDSTLCRLDPQGFMVGSPPGGYWTGTGIVDTATGLFRPWVGGSGIKTLVYHLNGCTDTMIMTVLPIWAGYNQVACPGSAPFTVSNFSPAGGTWTGPFVTPQGVFNPSTAGSYTLTYTAPNGCTDTKVVHVNSLTVQADDTTCVNTTQYNMSFSPVGGVWTGPGVSNWYWGRINPSAAGVGTHMYIYTAQGCSDTVYLTVEDIVAQQDIVVCPSNPQFTLTATPAGGYWTGSGIIDSNGLFDPAWNSGNNFTSTALYHLAGCIDTTVVYVRNTTIGVPQLNFCITDAPISLNWSNVQRSPWNGMWSGPGVTDPDWPGTFDPSVAGGGTHTLVYDANNCVDSMVMVVYDPQPQGDTTVCETSPSFNLTATPAGGIWSGFGIVNAAAGTFDPQITSLGNFTVYYTVGPGCVDSLVVTVDPLVPVAITGLDTVYCYRNFDDAFNVSPPGGALTGSGLNGQAFNPFLAGPGWHMVYYTFGSGFCAVTDSVRIRVRDPLQVSVNPAATSICYGDYTTLSVSGTGGRPVNHVFNWSHGLGFGSSKTVNPQTTTTYTITLSDNCSEDAIATATVTVHPQISVTPQPGPLICYGDTGTLTLVAPSGSNYSYVWDVNPPQTGNTISGLVGFYQATVTDDNTGCSTEILAEIEGYSVIDANFIPNPNAGCVTFLDPEFDFIDLSTGGLTGFWDFGDGATANYAPGFNPIHNYGDTGQFLVYLYIENEGGCPDEFQMQVCVSPAATIYAPNGFTPNGDGNNDVFKIVGIGVTEMDMMIFNRWGEMLFQTNDPNDGWDGTFEGGPVTGDVYTYLIRYKDKTGPERKTLKGVVAVVR